MRTPLLAVLGTVFMSRTAVAPPPSPPRPFPRPRGDCTLLPMYTPRHFVSEDRPLLLRLMREHGFGLLLCAEAEGVLEASHLPFLVEDDRIACHVARGNRLAELAAAGKTMTAVFSGPHAYVSPRDYAEPDQHVPTWNYAVVHATAKAAVLDEAGLRALIGKLTREHEQDRWAPGAHAEKLYRAVVGIELRAPRLEGKLKLSQNRSQAERDQVRQGLEARGDSGLAALMR